MMKAKYVSKHREISPLRFDGLKFPSGEGWTAETPPEGMAVKRVQCLRLSDGTTKIYRQLVPKKISKAEQSALRQRAADKLAEVIRENTVATVRKEKILVRQPRKPRKTRRSRRAKKTV
jgi:hypothetical protein